MRYIVGSVCICMYIFISWIWSLNANNLSSLQEVTIQKLEGIEEKVDEVLEKVERRVANSELQESIQQNQEEIKQLVDEKTEAIHSAESIEEIKEIVVDTAKRVILKTYDGVTDKDSLEETVSVDGSISEKQEAVQVAKNSMVNNSVYTVQVTTMWTYESAMKKLKLFDSQVEWTLLFEDGKKISIQITLSQWSLLAQELLSELHEWQVPDALMGFKVHKPEVYRIGDIDLWGEWLERTWWIQEYASYTYREWLRDSKEVISVWVIDTGVDMHHPDLRDRISSSIRGYDFVNNDTDPSDDHYHGTHVAWTIAASHNGEWVVGVNPYVEIVPLKICTASGYCPSYAITNALKYAADQQIDVLNMSLGGRGTVANNSTCNAINYAVSKWVIPVVAAGNANSPVEYSIPWWCPNTITVGAYDNTYTRASFSNYGKGVDVSAPGVDIYSAQPWGYKKTSGTSMATPHIVWVVSMLLMQDNSLSLEQIKQLLVSQPVHLHTKSTKPIGVWIDVDWLLINQWFDKNEVFCDGQVCAFAEVQETLQTELSGNENEWISVSAEVFDIAVWQTKALVIAWGDGRYHMSKNNQNIWFLQSQGVGIASTESNKEIRIEQWNDEYVGRDEYEERIDEQISEEETQQEQLLDEWLFTHTESVWIASSTELLTINLLWLVPWETILTVTDQTWEEKIITVRVQESIYRIKPNQYSYLYPREGWEIARRGKHTTPWELLSRFSYYRRGAYKISAWRYAEWEGIMKRTIYNHYERKNQTMQWTLRVSQTKERQPLTIQWVSEVLELEVWDKRTVNVMWWVPKYSVSHSSSAVRIDRPKYANSSNKTQVVARKWVGIASADQEESDLLPITIYEDEDEDPIIETQEALQENEIQWEQLHDQEDFSWEEITFGEINQYEQSQESKITIASAISKHPVEIYAVNPWESIIQIVDMRWEIKTIQVLVKEKVEERNVWDRFKWYYRAGSRQPFHVAYVHSSNQDIVRTYYKSKNFYAEIVQPGKAEITIGIAAKKRGRAYTTMKFTVVARSDQPLGVSQEEIVIPVWQRKDIILSWWLPKYIVSKSNENVWLGNSNTTQVIGVAWNMNQDQAASVYILENEWTDEYTAVDEELPEQSQNSIPTIDGMQVEYEDEEQVGEQVTIAAAVPQVKLNSLSIIGLTPWSSEVKVTDQLWDTKTVIVTVIEPEIQITKTSLKLRFVEIEHEYGQRREYLDAWVYHDERKWLRPYAVERISSTSSRVYWPYFRKFRWWYGIWGIWWEAIVTYHIYLPLEKRKASYSHVVRVLWPTIEEVAENHRLWEIHKRTHNGRRSSIWGGSDNDQDNIYLDQENEDTSKNREEDNDSNSWEQDTIDNENIDFSNELVDFKTISWILKNSEVLVWDINTLTIPVEEWRVILIDLDDWSLLWINEDLHVQSWNTCPVMIRKSWKIVKYQLECSDSTMEIPLAVIKSGNFIIGLWSVSMSYADNYNFDSEDERQFTKVKYRSWTRSVRIEVWEKIEYFLDHKNRFLINHEVDDESILWLAEKNDGIELIWNKLWNTKRTMKVFDIIKQEYIKVDFSVYVVWKWNTIPKKWNDFLNKLIVSGTYMQSLRNDDKRTLTDIYFQFYNKVKPYGPRDYKNNEYKWIKKLLLASNEYTVDTPGNFAFWYAAAAWWIPIEIQALWSFWAQIIVDGIDWIPKLDFDFFLSTFEKEKEDIPRIVKWALLYRAYWLNITTTELSKYLYSPLQELWLIDSTKSNQTLDNIIRIAENE